MKHTRFTAAAAAFLMLSGICGTVPQTSLSAITAYAETEGDFEFKIYRYSAEDRSAYIVKYHGTDGNVVIPESFRDAPVTDISNDAFPDKTLLKKVTLPESLTWFTSECFRDCVNLEEFQLSSQTDLIIGEAFSGCKNLESVFLPDKLSIIGMKAFAGCTALKEIKLPMQLTEIQCGTFSGCESLADIVFPSWGFVAEREAFTGTAWLKKQQEANPCVVVSGTLIDVSACSGELVLPDSVRRIARNIFYDQNALTKVVFPETYTQITECLFWNCRMLQEVVFRAEDVRVIPRFLFYACNCLKSVTLPKNCYQIESYAFDCCFNLESLYIPDTVVQIDEEAFNECPNLILEGGKGYYAEKYAKENGIPFRIANFLTTPDLNGSGRVSPEDVRIMQAFLLQKPVPLSNWTDADLNSDGFVDASDLSLLKQRLFRDERFSPGNRINS